jgi:hypothetical protein
MTAHRRTARPGTAERYEQPKVLVRDTGNNFEATFDGDNFYVKDVLVVAHREKCTQLLLALLGLLNSRLLRWYYKTSFPTLHVQRDELASLPIVLDHEVVLSKAMVQFVSLVEEILNLHYRFGKAKTNHQRIVVERQIEATDREIDRLVYELYGLSEDEIRLVEGATK